MASAVIVQICTWLTDALIPGLEDSFYFLYQIMFYIVFLAAKATWLGSGNCGQGYNRPFENVTFLICTGLDEIFYRKRLCWHHNIKVWELTFLNPYIKHSCDSVTEAYKPEEHFLFIHTLYVQESLSDDNQRGKKIIEQGL